MGCYNLTKGARDRLLPLITSDFERLWICHGFKVEQEPIFAYMSRVLIDDAQYGLWVIAYTE